VESARTLRLIIVEVLNNVVELVVKVLSNNFFEEFIFAGTVAVHGDAFNVPTLHCASIDRFNDCFFNAGAPKLNELTIAICVVTHNIEILQLTHASMRKKGEWVI
jgi:hypothetical protein